MQGAGTRRRKPVKRPIEPAPEPLWLLRSLPYGDYRNTAHWRRRRESYTASVVHRYGVKVCEYCLYAEPSTFKLSYHVHHVTYDRLGEETNDDLVLLCSPCHNLVHREDSHAAQHWMDVLIANGRYDYFRLEELRP